MIVICAGVMSCAGLGLLATAATATAAYGLCVVFGASAGMLPAIVFEGAAASVADRRLVPLAMGMIMQASNIGVFVGPICFSAAIQAGGWTGGATPLLAAIGVLIGIALCLVERRRSQAPLASTVSDCEVFGRK